MADPPSNSGTGEIKRLSKEVSSRICTAQVVVTLSGAVRQLVDNSLDAGAQLVDIRAKNNGFSSIEVVDDGSGIEAANFDAICKPHSTSKLHDLSGFQDLSTLGFRGEALNALCALGSVSILTRAASSLLGTRLVFDHNGEIIQKSNIARPVGTTVTVENLFETLPVRRKELEKTCKREFGRVLSTVQCFALSRPDVKLICSNTVGGKRVQAICTPGKATVKEVVTNLFGGRSDKNKMLELKRTLPDDEVCSVYGLDPSKMDEYEKIQITGFVSSCEHGFGRSAADRQFVYVNQRPIDYAKVCRAVNEVYQQYNRSQYPTLVLFIQVPSTCLDVNVTPDKRTVLFDGERHLLALVRASVLSTFQTVLGNYTSLEDRTPVVDVLYPQKSPAANVYDLLRDLSHSSSKRSGSSFASSPSVKRTKTEDAPPSKTLKDFSFQLIPHKANENRVEMESLEDSELAGPSGEVAFPFEATPSKQNSYIAPSSVQRSAKKSAEKENKQMKRTEVARPIERRLFTSNLLTGLSKGFEHGSRADDEVLDAVEGNMDDERIVLEESTVSESSFLVPPPAMFTQMDSDGTFLRPTQTVKFSVSDFRRRMQTVKAEKAAKSELASQSDEFCAPMENQPEAEAELSRRLTKKDLEEMAVLGQFNNGFIVTRLGDQLFIVDQHASDEKYNFERFQKKAKIETQRLLSPQALDFGAVQESVLRDNLNIFRSNGFEFEFKEDEGGCTRAFLVAVPVLHSWQFDRNDIDEILSVVRDFPGEMYRPTKLRRIFASRACRKSVMVGTALTKKHMERIVHNLSTLDQPWNCPHGRPTLRHLIDLRKLSL